MRLIAIFKHNPNGPPIFSSLAWIGNCLTSNVAIMSAEAADMRRTKSDTERRAQPSIQYIENRFRNSRFQGIMRAA